VTKRYSNEGQMDNGILKLEVFRRGHGWRPKFGIY
jgi:hypothetical protein